MANFLFSNVPSVCQQIESTSVSNENQLKPSLIGE